MIDPVRRSARGMVIAVRDDPNDRPSDGPMKNRRAVMTITSDRGESR